MVARICLPLVSLWTALRSGRRPSPHAFSRRIDRSRPRTLQQRNDIYGLENDDKMQTCIFWSTSRPVPMSCTALEMRCDAEDDIQMQMGAAPDDLSSCSSHDLSGSYLHMFGSRCLVKDIKKSTDVLPGGGRAIIQAISSSCATATRKPVRTPDEEAT